MAERKGGDFRRWLRSAERFSEWAIAVALRCLKTASSRVMASLRSVTRCDHLRAGRLAVLRCAVLRRAVLVLVAEAAMVVSISVLTHQCALRRSVASPAAL